MTETKSDWKTDGPAAEELAVQLAADTRLQPGEDGLWQVWGAGTHNIRKGDVLATKNGEDYVLEEVASVESLHGVRYRITTPSGGTFSLGALFTGFQLFRKGTKNTLA